MTPNLRRRRRHGKPQGAASGARPGFHVGLKPETCASRAGWRDEGGRGAAGSGRKRLSPAAGRSLGRRVGHSGFYPRPWRTGQGMPGEGGEMQGTTPDPQGGGREVRGRGTPGDNAGNCNCVSHHCLREGQDQTCKGTWRSNPVSERAPFALLFFKKQLIEI